MKKYNGYWVTQWNHFEPFPSGYVYQHGIYKKAFCKNSIFLDTETSRIIENGKAKYGWIYQWAFVYGKVIVYGRTPSELVSSVKKVVDVNYDKYINRVNEKNRHKYNGTGEEYRLLLFIHNAPYDWEYLRKFFDLEFGKCKFFADRPHKVFCIDYPDYHLTIRCTYKLSNKSLDKWSKDLQTEHRKLVDTVDYDLIRYQDSSLSREDWCYQFNDVIVLKECLEKQLELYNDSLVTLPLTSTKYTRRLIENKYKENPENAIEFKKTRINAELYTIARRAFMGGISHGNFEYYGVTIRDDIAHYDFRSHYPTQQICKKFPVGKTVKYYDLETDTPYDGKIEDFLPNDEYCYILELYISGIKLKSIDLTMPYLSFSKLIRVKKSDEEETLDNGRVMIAGGTYLYDCTDLDLKWLLKQYNINDILISKVFRAKKGKLPSYITDVINESFLGKSKYKMKCSEIEKLYGKDSVEYFDAEVSEMKSKNALNGIYGVSATDPVRDEVVLNGDEWIIEKKSDIDDIEAALKKFYSHKTTCMSFLYGLFTTAWARDELMEMIELVGYNNFLYCDTDSVFFRANSENLKALDEKNKHWYDDAIENGYYVECEGNKITYHAFNPENRIRAFRYLHSKCYACEEWSEKHNDYMLECTVAGVRKKATYWEKGEPHEITRNEELGHIDNLKDGFVFSKTGSSQCVYIDHDIGYENINGHKTLLANAAVIVPSTTTLSTIELGLDIIEYELTE